MNQKQIGVVILVIGLLMSVFVLMSKIREEKRIKEYVEQNGTCFTKSGKCLHLNNNSNLYIFGLVLSFSLLMFGTYLTFIDKTHEKLMQHQKDISLALREAKKNEKEKNEFKAFLSSFTEDEQKILKAVKEQEGILQSTLKYRADMSKTSLSLILKSLEERGFIKRETSGKSNKVYLINKF